MERKIMDSKEGGLSRIFKGTFLFITGILLGLLAIYLSTNNWTFVEYYIYHIRLENILLLFGTILCLVGLIQIIIGILKLIQHTK